MAIYNEALKAGVQYNDLLGTAAADRGDSEDFESFLSDKGLLDRSTEHVVAVRFWSGENHGGAVSDAGASAIVADISGYETLDDMLKDGGRPRFRGIRLDMKNDEFFGYFKRFEVVLHLPNYADLIGSEFEVEYMEE